MKKKMSVGSKRSFIDFCDGQDDPTLGYLSLNSTLSAESVPDVSTLSRSISVQFRDGVVELKINDQPYRLSEALWDCFVQLKMTFDEHKCEANTVFKLDQNSMPYYQTLQELLNRTVQNTSGKEVINVSDFEEILKHYCVGDLKKIFHLHNVLNYFQYDSLDLFKDLNLCSGMKMSIDPYGISLIFSSDLNLEQLDPLIPVLCTKTSYSFFDLNFMPQLNIGPILEKFSNIFFASLTLSSHLMSDIQLNDLVPALVVLTRLTSLDLSKNKIKGSTLAPIFRNLSKLEHLNLSVNYIKCQHMKDTLSTSLCSLTHLKTFNFSKNSIGPSSGKFLAQAFMLLTNLESLDLSKNSLRNAGIQHLSPALQALTNLKTLSLEDDQIILKKSQSLLETALLPLRCLAHLNLSSNIIQNLDNTLSALTSLHRLDLRSNQLGHEGARALSAALSSLTGLSDLSLSGNYIGAAGAAALAASLNSLSSLQRLDLGNNSIGDDGAGALAAALPALTGLQSLDLSDNQLGAAGASSLAASLNALTSLQSLDLSDNQLGDDGAVALAAALPALTGLQILDLRFNQLGVNIIALLRTQLTHVAKLDL